MSQAIAVDVLTERTIVRNALLRLFNSTMTSALIEGFYAQNPTTPQFLDADVSMAAANGPATLSPSSLVSVNSSETTVPQLSLNAAVVAPPAPVGKPEFRLQVADFADTYFAKDYFPKFRATVSGKNPLPSSLSEFQVQISVRNKWVDVTTEAIAPNTELVRTVKDGVLEVSDLIFIDVSLKHGGYFTLHITPVGQEGVVAAWTSPRFVIQSVKTHCNKKRKSREAPSTVTQISSLPGPSQMMMQNAHNHNGASQVASVRMPGGFVVNDVKAFLAPSNMQMDAMDYGLSGGFFDSEPELYPF